MSRYTNEQIASNEGLWDEYYNIHATDPFDDNTYEERLVALNRDYPDELS